MKTTQLLLRLPRNLRREIRASARKLNCSEQTAVIAALANHYDISVEPPRVGGRPGIKRGKRA